MLKSRAIGLSAALLSLMVVLWLGIESAGPDELLVLPDRVMVGPARTFAPPWRPHRVVARPLRVESSHQLSFGVGSDWDWKFKTELTVDPDRLDNTGRALLLDGAEAWLRREIDAALARSASASAFEAKSLLAKPASLADVVRAPVRDKLPAGLFLVALESSLVATPEQARALAAGGLEEASRPPLSRVLYLGLDGADWEVIMPLMRRGELPHLARMMREGVSAELVSYEPMMSPLLWTTALTGRDPKDHSICDFVLSTGGEDVVPIMSTTRTAAAVWEILSSRGQPSAFMSFWATNPAEEIEGAMISDLATAQLSEGAQPKSPLAPGTLHPENALQTIWANLRTTSTIESTLFTPLAKPVSPESWAKARAFWLDQRARHAWKEQNPKGRRRPPEAFLVRLAAQMINTETVGLHWLRQPNLGVIGLYFEEIDLAGHYFQHDAPPVHPLSTPEDRRVFGETVESVYRMQDRTLGRLFEAVGPDTTIILHSDHGFAWGERRPLEAHPFTLDEPVEWHRHIGVFLAKGPGIRKGVSVRRVNLFEIAPLLLALRGLPASEAMSGSLRTDLFEPEYADRLPQQRIASWDLLVPPRRYSNGGAELDEEAQEQLLETLRGLGYVSDTPRSERRPDKPRDGVTIDKTPRPNVNYWRNLATWLMNQDRFAEAEEALAKAHQAKPLPKTYWLLSEARAARGDLVGAIDALERGVSAMPDQVTPANIVWLTELQIRRQDLPAAKQVLAKHRAILDRDPGTAALADGIVAEADQQRELAKARYFAALQHNARETRAAERFAQLATDANERARLRPIVERGLQQDPRIEQYWKMLGLLAMESGEYDRAFQAFQRAAELDPRDHSVRVAAAQLGVRLGQAPWSRQQLEALIAEGTVLPQAYLNLGALRAAAGDWTGALEVWRLAESRGIQSDALRRAIADAQRRGG
jgi:tetratricopeptide (TPR) repeat protein